MRKSMIWIIFAAMAVLAACVALPGGKMALPEAKDLNGVSITASELELTINDEGAVVELLDLLRQSVKQDAGRASVRDIPNKDAGLVRMDFSFTEGGTSTLFLYREGEKLFLEQPHQGIYEMDNSLEQQLRIQVALGLARAQTEKQE